MNAQAELFSKPSFHNTVKLKGEKHRNAEKYAKTQEGIIIAFFQDRPNESFTPWEVWEFIDDGSTPYGKFLIGSVRRSITNLTDAGKLTELEKLKDERHGLPNKQWTLRK